MRGTGNRDSAGPPGFTAQLSVYGSGARYVQSVDRPRSAPALLPYDRGWPRVFAAERQRIQAALGSLATAVEHVGSSSIPGLWGRAEIDILVGVRDRAGVEAGGRLLTGLGYAIDDAARAGQEPWRLLSRPGPIPFELLLVEHGSALWNRHLGLRDYLLADPARALEYGRLKSSWATRYGPGTRGYKEAKRRFWAGVQVPDQPAAVTRRHPVAHGS